MVCAVQPGAGRWSGTGKCPSLAIGRSENNARLLRGLEIGVNDYLLRPVDKNELLARARTQIRKRRYTDHLRDNVQIPSRWRSPTR